MNMTDHGEAARHYVKELELARELARLRAENERFRHALTRIARPGTGYQCAHILDARAALDQAAAPVPGPCGHCARSWDDCTADHVRTGRRCCYSCGHEATSQEGT